MALGRARGVTRAERPSRGVSFAEPYPLPRVSVVQDVPGRSIGPTYYRWGHAVGSTPPDGAYHHAGEWVRRGRRCTGRR
jgi:hypothetical protein